MTTKRLEKIGRRALLISPVVIAVVGFFAVLHWLKPKNAAFVLVLSAAFSIFVMGYAGFLARRVQRRLDEVEIASQGFASFRGWIWGNGATVLLLLLPPVTNWLIDLANRLTTGSPDMSGRGSVHVALYFGFVLLVLMQTVCVAVAAAIWWRRMERP